MSISVCVPPGDRKITRLNSSHVRISYAVFCLKKKIEPAPLNSPATRKRKDAISTTYLPTVVTPLPGVVRAADAALKLWGDEASGFVNDWIYVSNDKIQQLVFSLAPD